VLNTTVITYSEVWLHVSSYLDDTNILAFELCLFNMKVSKMSQPGLCMADCD